MTRLAAELEEALVAMKPKKAAPKAKPLADGLSTLCAKLHKTNARTASHLEKTF